MKTHQRTRLASAVLAAASGISMLALTAPADARDIEEEFQDEALIFPYYTVRDGWTTLANVTNTSPFTIIAKVRYRESYNSRDVLDFNVILSPFDVWTGWVAEGPNGPRLSTRDSSCTTPIFTDAGDGSRYADFSNLGYLSDGGPTGIDRTREGHFEVITMGQFFPGSEDEKWDTGDSANWEGNNISWSAGDPKYPTAYYAKHVDGKPRNCEMVDSRFEATASPFDIDDVVNGSDWSSDGNPLAEWDNQRNRSDWPMWDPCDPFTTCITKRGDAGDVLKGNFNLVNVGQGIAAGGIPVSKSMDCNFDDRDLITAQQYPWFLEPTLYSAGDSGPNCELWAWSRQHSDDLDVAALNNEWSTNDNTGAATDWVVTFPTKEFHVDISETDLYAGANPVRLIREGLCSKNGKWSCDINDPSGDKDTFKEAFLAAGGLFFDSDEGFEEYFGETSDGQSCDTVVYNLWDREEAGVQGDGTSISPAPPQPTDSLCYETNILSFQDESSLGSALATKVDTSILPSGAAAGWLKLQMTDDCSFTTGEDDYCDDGELPAVGFAFKARDFGDPSRNFGVLTEYGYDD